MPVKIEDLKDVYDKLTEFFDDEENREYAFTSDELAEKIGHSRVTILKYLNVLESEKAMMKKRVMLKVYYHLPIGEVENGPEK